MGTLTRGEYELTGSTVQEAISEILALENEPADHEQAGRTIVNLMRIFTQASLPENSWWDNADFASALRRKSVVIYRYVLKSNETVNAGYLAQPYADELDLIYQERIRLRVDSDQALR